MFSLKTCISYRNNVHKRVFSTVMAAVTLSLALMGAAVDTQRKSVAISVYDDFSGVNSSDTVITRKATVAEFLEEQGVELGGYDKVSMGLDDLLTSGEKLIVTKGISFTLICDGEIHTLPTTKRIIRNALAENGITVGSDDVVEPALDKTITQDSIVSITRVTYSTEKVNVDIPYEKVTVEDENLYEGTSEVRTTGVNGVLEEEYKLKYEDGNLVERVKVSEAVTAEPVAEVTAIGTKPTKPVKDFSYSKSFTVTCTAYEETFGSMITASGKRLKVGLVAVDPRVIPLGTKLYIESSDGGESWVYGYCEAADTGGAIKGNKIDLCLKTRYDCIQFGRRSATVYILD